MLEKRIEDSKVHINVSVLKNTLQNKKNIHNNHNYKIVTGSLKI